MLWFAPNMFFEMGGVEPTDDLRGMARYLGLAMAAIAGFHWIIPMWSGDDIKKFAQVTAPLWEAFFLMNVYDLYVEITPSSGQNIFGDAMLGVFGALFYLKPQ
jgi:hypothetical protein